MQFSPKDKDFYVEEEKRKMRKGYLSETLRRLLMGMQSHSFLVRQLSSPYKSNDTYHFDGRATSSLLFQCLLLLKTVASYLKQWNRLRRMGATQRAAL